MNEHDNDELLDIVERLTRVECKLDALLESQKKRFDVGVRTWVALIAAVAAIAVAFIK
jgi:hypothetical protein